MKMLEKYRLALVAIMATTSLTCSAVWCQQNRQNLLAVSSPSQVPYNWQSVEMVGGGFISGIVFHPKQPNLIYARTDIGGAYRWNPITRHWVALTDQFGADDWNMYGIESIALDPTDASRVYIAAGTYTNDWAGNGAILRSTDQGKTWARTNLPFKNGGNEDGRSAGERLVVDPLRPNVLYFGTRRNGLWKSEDRGATWYKVETFPANENTNGIGINFVIFAPDHTLYAGVADKTANLYRSHDEGKSWEVVAGGGEGLFPHHGVFDGTTLYLTYGDGPGPNGMTSGSVWKLNTISGAWTEISPLQPNKNGEAGFGYAGLTVDAAHPGTVMVATMDRWAKGDDVFRSLDGGATWKSVRATSQRDSSAAPYLNFGAKEASFGHWIGDVEIDPFNSNHSLYVTGATMWGTDDLGAGDAGQPTHWTPRAQGIEEISVRRLISPPTGAHLISGVGDVGGFRHDDLTVSPAAGMSSNPRFTTNSGLDFAEMAPDIVVRVGSAGQGTRRGAYSLDGGSTWAPFVSEPPGSQGSGTVAVSANGKTVVWTPEKGAAFVSKDWGANWTKSEGLRDNLSVTADRVNPNTFYALDSKAKTLYASTDSALTFQIRCADLPTGATGISPVPGHEGDLWVTAGGSGLFHSADGGATFSKIAGVQVANGLGFGKAAPGSTSQTLYLAGNVADVVGIYRSTDGGVSWVRINDAAHQYGWIGRAITGDPRIFGRVYMGTNGRGIIYGDPLATQ